MSNVDEGMRTIARKRANMIVRKPMRSAFTLLELLVVLAIISVLASIVLPSMRRGRETARNIQCLSRLRALATAHMEYLQEYDVFPYMNKDSKEHDDGAWQYNYLIFDGTANSRKSGFEHNFGPLVHEGVIDNIETLFCPVQTHPWHRLATQFNPWPVKDEFRFLDTRAGYGRRYHLSGKSIARLRGNPAFLADVLHMPSVIETSHVDGVNAAYIDGHAQWVPDPGILTDNELTHPFPDITDIAGLEEENETMDDIWDALNEAGRTITASKGGAGQNIPPPS